MTPEQMEAQLRELHEAMEQLQNLADESDLTIERDREALTTLRNTLPVLADMLHDLREQVEAAKEERDGAAMFAALVLGDDWCGEDVLRLIDREGDPAAALAAYRKTQTEGGGE